MFGSRGPVVVDATKPGGDVLSPMTSGSESSATAVPDAFAAQALAAMEHAREAFGAILDSIGGLSGATEIAEALDLDKKLAWRVARVGRAEVPVLEVEHVPGRSAMEIVARACRTRGVSDALIDQATRAVAAVEELESAHAGDRATLSAMLSAVVGVSRDQGRVSLGQRKTAFKANRIVQGISTALYFRADILHPSSAPKVSEGPLKRGAIDIAAVRGYHGLTRLRSDVWCILHRIGLTTNQGQRTPFLSGALDPEASAKYGGPLMPAFCSQPLAPMRTHSSADGSAVMYIADWPVGLSSPLTLTIGDWYERVASCYAEKAGEYGEVFVRPFMPAELLVQDLIVHRALFPTLEPELLVFMEPGALPHFPAESAVRPRIPVAERVRHLGRAPGSLLLDSWGDYPSLIASACAARGWDLSAFDVYRVEMAYPPTPCTVAMRFGLRME